MPRKYEHWDEKVLTTGGVSHILRKVSGKILLAVGIIRIIGKEPLRLWKEYDGDGVILRGMMPAVSVEQDGYFTSEDYRKFLKMLEDIVVIFGRIEKVHNVLVGMAKSITEIRAELAEIEEHLTKLDNEIAEINATLDRIEARINELAKLIEEAEVTVNELKEGADDCLQDVKASGSGCLTLSASVSDQKATITGSVSDATETEAGMMTQQDKLWLDELWEKYQNGEFGCDCGNITYGDPKVSLSYDKAKAEDESLKPSYSYYQIRTDNDGNETRITSGGDLVFTIADKGEGVSINDTTGELTFPKNEDTSEKTLGTVTLSVTMSGYTGTASATAVQEGAEEPGPEPEPEPDPDPEITYNDPEARLYYDTIDAEGGTASPHLTVSQTYTDEQGEIHTVEDLLYTSSYSIKSSDYGATINSVRGTVTVEQANDAYEERVVAVVECVVTANGKETTVTADVQQEAKEYGITPDSVTVVIEPPVITTNGTVYKVNAELQVHKDGETVDTFNLTDDDIDEKLSYNHISLVWGWEGNDEPLSNYTDSDVGDGSVSSYVDFDTDAGTVYIHFPVNYANTAVPLGTVSLSITNINRQEVMYGQNSMGLSWDARG